MRQLVTIDLSRADIVAFEAYEARVLPLVSRHGGRVEARVRALDGGCETHLLYFPDADAFASFQADPARLLACEDWDRCGAAALVVEVEAVETSA